MYNAITVGRLPKYTVFLHGYTHFIHEWVTFRVPHHRGSHHETGKGAKGYGGHASFKYNIHVVGFVETSGCLCKSCGIIIIESKSQFLWELETKACQAWKIRIKCGLITCTAVLLCAAYCNDFLNDFCLIHSLFVSSRFSSKGALDQGCKTVLVGWTGTEFFFSLNCQIQWPAWMQTRTHTQ